METKVEQKVEVEKVEHVLAIVKLTVLLSERSFLTRWNVETPLIEKIKELSKSMKGNKA